MMSQDEAQWCHIAAPGDLALTAAGKGTPGVDRGAPACVPGSTDPKVAQTGTPRSWLPPPWQLVALEPPAGMGTCGFGGVWSSTCSAPTSAASARGSTGPVTPLPLGINSVF